MRDNELDFQLDSAIVRPLSTSPISPRSIPPSTPQQATLPIPNGTPRLPLPCRHLATDYASPPAGRNRVGTFRGPAGDRAISAVGRLSSTPGGGRRYTAGRSTSSVWIEIGSTIDPAWTAVSISIIGGNLTAGISEKQKYSIRCFILIRCWRSSI